MFKFQLKNQLKCRICDNKKLKRALDLLPTPIADYYFKIKSEKLPLFDLNLDFCQNCKYLFLSKTLEAKLSYTDYLYKTSTTNGLVKHYDGYIYELIKKFNIKSNSIAIDIGSNDGSMLRSMNKARLQAIGVEPAKKISDYANLNNLKTINSYFDKSFTYNFLNNYGKAKLITANYMFANVDDIRGFVKNVSTLIDSDGIFVIQTGYHPLQFKNMMFDYIYHEHYSYFSLYSLYKLLSKFNFKLIDASINNHKLGSLRAVFSLKNSKHLINKYNLNKVFKIENEYNYSPIKTLNNFKKKLDLIRINLNNFLIKNQDKKIVGFGASHSVTTFLCYFEIGNYISILVDDNNIKQNTFSPKFNIPVFDPSVLKVIKPDYIIILGWQHARAIISRHKNLIGLTSFIIPLPKFKIINRQNIEKFLIKNV